ncbi:DNA-binding Lrp family transcriptional regulator [Cytobacillus purgationiresistens]|uniref:DNA-binding Lrp family transcriptional regulator n=2 Tax=Cytobacillus purgationiresistens TaxID=863449 RepID=A0ABU0AD92_9BACI|nr:DNA-binding Lrp family transcriptional regulator [Cytobacillus purgationiresistens]
MKKCIDVIANEESYINLSTFKDIEGMNKTIRTNKDIIRATVKRSDVQVRLIALLELLKRHSCKQLGVSYMSKNTIADKLELSYKTVQRLMKKLEDLGMIRQVSMKRKKDMLQTANAIIIQPVQDDVSDKTPPKESEKCPTKTKPVSLKQNNKRLNKRNRSVELSSANFIAHWVPKAFADFTSNFYSKAETIQEFWKVVKQCNRVIDYENDKRAFTGDQELQIGVKAFKEFVMKLKAGTRMIKGEFAYFNGIVNKLMDKLYFDHDFVSQ